MQSLDDLFHDLRALVEDPNYPAARAWMEKNPEGKAMGHFQVYFPEELAYAAGMLPVKVAGAGSTIEARQADARIASFVCSVIKTSLELGLAGHLDFLSMYVTHPICDSARASAGVWARNFENWDVQILYLPQNANSAYSVDYLRGEYARILRHMETITGRKVTDDDLRKSIELLNENRRLLRELYRIKRETPWLINAVEAYSLTRAAGVMPRDEHNAILRRVLDELPSRPNKKQDRIRIVFEGAFCEQPPIDMLAVIQEACYIVDDDFMIGLRWILEDVPTEGDPLTNLADAYLNRSSYSVVQHDLRKPKEKMLLQRMKEAGAEAAIIAAAKMCEPGLEDQVAYSHALDDANVPHLVMEFEEKETIFEKMRMEVETFVESLMFDFEETSA